MKGLDGLWRATSAETIRRHRMNVGAIVSPAMLSVRIASGRRATPGRKIGEIEEGYLEVLEVGDTFVFAGQVWKLVGLTGMDVLVQPAPAKDAKMPSWGGSKFALSTFLAPACPPADERRRSLEGAAARCARVAGTAA